MKPGREESTIQFTEHREKVIYEPDPAVELCALCSRSFGLATEMNVHRLKASGRDGTVPRKATE